MPEPSRVPDELRQRIERQRRRQRLVRVTFPITVVVLVLWFFGFYQAQLLAPSARTVIAVPAQQELWLLDQHYDLAAGPRPGGAFALIHVAGDEVTHGMRYDGVVSAFTLIPGPRAGITVGLRFLEFDLTKEGWPRVRMESLGLNDINANPVVVFAGGELWLCYSRGSQVMIRPLDHPDVPARPLHETDSPNAVLGATVFRDDQVWLSAREPRTGELTLIAFRPYLEEIEPDGTAENTAPPAGIPADVGEEPAVVERPRRLAFEVISRGKVTGNARRAIHAVPDKNGQAVPVVGFIRKDERNWNVLVWDDTERHWRDADPPPRDRPLSTLEISNFLTFAALDGDILALFNDGRDVRRCIGAVKSGVVEWDAPDALTIDATRGMGAYLVWMAGMFVLFLVMASQSIWLLLNREQPRDRALARLLDAEQNVAVKKEKSGKNEPPMLYAGALPRGLALMLDLAVTSPIIIVLQDYYGYEWMEAYGFLALGSVAPVTTDLLATLQATLVTLLILTIYGMACELFWGKTFGKALFRLRVTNAKGEQPNAWRIVVRNLLKIVELIHWLVLILPMVLMMVSGRQQRLGDLAAGTYVIVDAIPEESPDDIDV